MNESAIEKIRRELRESELRNNPLLTIRGPKEYYEAFGILEALPVPDSTSFIDFLLECVERGRPMTKEERDRWFVPPEEGAIL